MNLKDRRKLKDRCPEYRKKTKPNGRYSSLTAGTVPAVKFGHLSILGTPVPKFASVFHIHLPHFHSLLLDNFLLGQFAESVFTGNERQAAPIVPSNGEGASIIHISHGSSDSRFHWRVRVIHVVQHNTCAGWIILSDRLHMLTARKRHIHLLFSSLSDNFINRVRIHSPSPP